MHTSTQRLLAGLAGLALLLAAAPRAADAAVIYQETFSSDPGGTYSILGGSSFNGSSGFEGSFGNTTADIDTGHLGGSSPSGNGSFEGSFNAQGVPAPETGTLRITDPAFLTDYDTAYPGYTTYYLGFAFYGSVLPADMLITIGNGVDTYIYNPLPQLTLAGDWNDVYVYFDSGWLGSGSSIPDPLNSMTYIDISWSRNGTAAQQFYLDDLTLFGTNDAPPPSSAVPEPGTGILFLTTGAIFALLRRQRARNAD